MAEPWENFDGGCRCQRLREESATRPEPGYDNRLGLAWLVSPTQAAAKVPIMEAAHQEPQHENMPQHCVSYRLHTNLLHHS